MREKATERLQQINSARDELTRYWREFGKAPPTSPFNDFKTGGRPSPDWQRAAQAAAAAPSRPATRSDTRSQPPGKSRALTLIKMMKWWLLLIVVWATWRPIPWNKEAAVIELFFWLLMLFGCAQLLEGIANALLGALHRRH